MAEFQEVIRQWARLCKAVDACALCPVNKYMDSVCSKVLAAPPKTLAEFERAIMDWAAEHPEPRWLSWN